MSGTKRTVLRRGRRPFGANVIALFVKLDRIPQERKAFSAGSRQLAELLGLEGEWLTGNSPLNPSPCHHSPGCCAYTDFHHCRAVRTQLIEAARQGSAS